MAINVLVVDDSAVVRTAMTQILGRVGMYVQTAPDPIIALEKMKAARPDVILLDIEMPRMDGNTFLNRVMATDPIPVVVCSGLAGPGTEVALHALEEGAVEIVTKPRLGLKGFLEDSATRIVHAVRAAAQARVKALTTLAQSATSSRGPFWAMCGIAIRAARCSAAAAVCG